MVPAKVLCDKERRMYNVQSAYVVLYLTVATEILTEDFKWMIEL